MENNDMQVETLWLSYHCPGIESRIPYLLASCGVWRAMISRRKRSH